MRFPARRISALARVPTIGVLVLVLSGCFSAQAIAHRQSNPNSRPWFCESELMPDEPGAAHYLEMGVSKGMLSWNDCLLVAAQFDEALTYAKQWPTRGEAEADGWTARVNYATGMGTHHARGNPLQGTFDPTRPTFLQYGGNTPDAKLVGISWYVENGPDEPPAGFAGDNDWWHVHEYLCISNTSGLVVFDGRCPTGVNGSTVYLGNYWLLHAWIVPDWEHRSDVFVGHHPCLLPSGPAAHDDPCWEMHM
jgi:hypothetical protein